MRIARYGGGLPFAAAIVVALLWSGSGMASAVDLAAAEAQFHKSCGTCHTVEANAPLRQGPNLRGVIGRKAASLPGFAYSDALKAAGGKGLVWTPDKIDQWITDAGKFIPGVNMMYHQADPAKRQLVIQYLESVSK
ncbi:MAG TPA: c-type cytochrome [Hypericibacter adhaerens]|jgi:cytochrome c|uniref:Cytochrome c n=1 Tax=Hypericibacter adhaerens TaxID=2602016 RepID=A0A5J6N0P1_9PROT|nr:c-type cytochrome [Hypericibacter adhaerens]QEX22814.1 cytochrome c [Hypericibacter adhaerens]HWA44963.1 c-type cytochrome [Hypericibacter adhaerens]